MAFAQLIPGLPNDLAIQCLLCLSSKDLLRAQEVSSLWKIAITSDRFYVERRLRAPYPSICAILRFRSGYQIFDTDVTHLSNPRLLFSCDSKAGQMLFPPGVVFASVGASVLAFAPGGQVQKFSLLTRRWIPLNKFMPLQCKLWATTLGKHVILLACKHYDDNSDDDPVPHAHGHAVDDGVLRHTMSEVFDSENNQWASLEGLPDAFAGTHCVTCQGICYVMGKANALPFPVYALNLSKRRWEEDMHMTDRMQYVLPESKVIIKPDASLSALLSASDTLWLRHQRATAFDWMHVEVNVTPPVDSFVFEQGDEIFLVVADAGLSWRSRTFFFHYGLTILHIPSDELLMVELIVGKMSCERWNSMCNISPMNCQTFCYES